MKNKIAIVGATGLVGNTILKVLYEENLFWGYDIILFASSRSAGKEFLFKGRLFRILKLDENALKQKFDYVFFSAGSEVSLGWAKKFAETGAVVIDNTNAFRKEKEVPLVVPEINFSKITNEIKLISNPNCSTIQLAVVLNKLVLLGEVDKVVVSTFQSVSGAGRRALFDLEKNAKNVFKYGINNEIIAKIGEIQENYYTIEENKIIFELSKILEKKIDVSATAVRVPTTVGHGESVYVKFKNQVSVIDALAVLECDYISVRDDVFYLCEVRETNLTYVCRLRQKNENELEFFVMADNLRRGAAYNAVKIVKYLISKNKINEFV